jgi:hypothetical protein
MVEGRGLIRRIERRAPARRSSIMLAVTWLACSDRSVTTTLPPARANAASYGGRCRCLHHEWNLAREASSRFGRSDNLHFFVLIRVDVWVIGEGGP